MGTNRKRRAIAVVMGVVLIATTATTWLLGAKSGEKPVQVGPLPESVIAPADQLSRAYAAVAAHVRPCVVSVYSEKIVKMQAPQFEFPFGDDFFRQFFGQQSPSQPQPSPRREYRVPQRGMGSGMIIDKQGHILTNYHVVRDVDEIKVRLADQRTFEAEIVSTDPPSDVAVIRLKGRVPDDLPAVEFGDSDRLEVGDLVLAVGAPFGYVQTVTRGIISAKGRSGVGINAYEDFLQTDAAINPGNSGGPLVNMHGQVIGINSAIATSVGQFAGVGFAIPINMVKTILPTLMKGEKVTRGMLGVIIQPVTADLAKQFGLGKSEGALVSQVNKDSPAGKAGIKPGDVIIRYNGREVDDTAHLRNMVAATAPGAKARVDLIRNGKEQTVDVTVAKLESEKTAAAGAPSEGGGGARVLDQLGLSVQTLTPDLAKQLGDEGDQGAVITRVQQGSLAAVAGLQSGDLILQADHQDVASADDFQRVLEKAKDKDSILLLVKRKGASVFVVIQTK